ncbi:TIM barrel protein [Aquamicrobium sp. LC103]|uniref:sugar phosphate isomerase/epimerase family protein n=1 Tax=Aquamicrobium sp. LC103 TaxID=1120658 RepID=UPI00063E8ABB|nr:TIM barrel protein [Aquamicrobium sp. LC103]TKT69468.1 TIM barrel protein [Aquamicrobium sp. LC103]
MRKSIAHLTLSTTPGKTIAAAAKAGFDGAGIRICGRFVGDDSFQDIIGDRTEITRLHALTRDLGVVISNISAFQFYPGLTRDHLKGVVETAAGLGADTLVVNCFMKGRDEALSLFAAYDEMAREAGMRIALEFLPYSTVRDLAEARAFIKDSGASVSRLLIDALHLERSGGSVDDIASLDGGEIAFWQICDARQRNGAAASDDQLMREARTARLPLGEGDLPLRALLAALPADLEIEYEVADASIRHLPEEFRAKAAMEDLQRFLAMVSADAN